MNSHANYANGPREQYDPKFGCTGQTFIEPEKGASQVDELLTEHARLLSDLSDEIVRARHCFDAVLLPEPPTGNSDSPNVDPSPARSALGYAIKDQSDRVRSMLASLRSINSRSTV
ncbi:hypothetical protein [Stenotrophomonas maltophilia]|uniref:hypothetical protein n=1 Tax=Stenotrophomonas maltophilia TaxID=40324 RepID=UPI0021C57B51|nr:hypothetical protein [Stenotrophomonas maltophilia]MCU1139448.1 hypothetical protein [Stenotrophomonas maltophilia]